MKSPYRFIVRPVGGDRYVNTKNIDGVELITNVSEESHKNSNRFAEVVSTPIGYNGPIEPGEKLIVHHNVFKYYNDTAGRRRSANNFFRDGLFTVGEDEFFMYSKSGEWNAYGRYCFVSPVKAINNHFLSKSGKYEPLNGVMEYPSEYLISQGINKGDKICFTPDSEYEFEIDEKLMYRVFDHQITIKL